MIVLAKAAGKKIALRAQTVFPAGAFTAAAWCPENLQCACREDATPAFLVEKDDLAGKFFSKPR